MSTREQAQQAATRPVGTGPGDHEHGWRTESAHRTSEGTVRYVRCPACGARRVDLQRGPEQPPVALSGPVPRPAGAASPAGLDEVSGGVGDHRPAGAHLRVQVEQHALVPGHREVRHPPDAAP